MGHLARMRPGWNNQHLAAGLLGEFAFIAGPVTVGDDVGADFVCTIFHTDMTEKAEVLVPGNSFAIQIKSNDRSFEVKNWEYLWNLEIPFFVGVLDRKALSLEIYSGQYLPSLFSHHGRPGKLTIRLCSTVEADEDPYSAEEGHHKLQCGHVARLVPDASNENRQQVVGLLRTHCEFMQRNIAARLSNEYTFFYPDDAEGKLTVRGFAGKTSAKHFRRNFLIRFGEVGHNLLWLYQKRRADFNCDEFEMYEGVLHQLRKHYGDLPEYLTEPFDALRDLIEAQ